MDSKIIDLKAKFENIILQNINADPKEDDPNLVEYPITYRVKMAVEQIIEELIREKTI